MAISDLILVLTASCSTALLALWWALRSTVPQASATEPAPDPMALLFENGVLHHANETALMYFSLHPGEHHWEDMRDGLVSRFPDFPSQAGSGVQGHMTLFAKDDDGPDRAQIRWRGPLCWVTLITPEVKHDRTEDKNLHAELVALRRMSNTAPNPVWQEDSSGEVCWFNPAYESLFKLAHGGAVDVKMRLFSEGDRDAPTRVSLHTTAGEKPDWYQLSAVTLDDVTIYHATCINAVVEAEEAQRNFVQTLAKTFAHLSIGLAIFDRNRQLVLFNPALVDLTGLPAHFLSARPSMLSFFDQLREDRRMPEPKNYLNWRQEIADVIAAATDGRYQETWSLESGQTYSVKGRPHPDGATAFLIEDISAEMTLTRNFRAELEQGQFLLDMVDDAMAVFSPTGILTLSNAAYCKLWQLDPDSAFADVTIRDSIKAWKAKATRTPMWQAVEDFVAEYGDRSAWEMPIRLKTGQSLTCQVVPVASGSTLIRFTRAAVAQKVIESPAHTAAE